MFHRFPAAVPAFLLTCVVALGACATPERMPIERVIAGGQGGQCSSGIIQSLKSSKTTYALRGSDYGRLREAGVADEVLDHVQQQFIDDVDLLTRYWALGESVGGCQRCLPLEVDLRDISMPRAVPTSASMRPDRPQGMPSWYRPYAPRRNALSLAQVEEMHRSGISEQEMIGRIRASRLEGVVGVGGLGTFRTHPVAGVSGAQLADLRSAGVPDLVIDEVQTLFLAQFVEIERLRYQNLGKGPRGPNN